MIRFSCLVLALALVALTGCASGDAESSSSDAASRSGDLPTVTVYKGASCSCCARWAEHMEEAGFTVETRDVQNLGSRKDALGVPQRLRSCHTATVDGEIIEGHVPARVVKGYLRGDEKARAQGLAVPQMPVGSPGMEVGPPEPYHVLAFKKDGRVGTYSRHNQQAER